MNNYEDLIIQIEIRQFKNMSFSLYNYISDESGYFYKLKKKDIDCSIDDMQSLLLEVTEDEKKLIKMGVRTRFDDLKSFIESKTDELAVFILEKYGAVYVVKPKSFDMSIIQR
ncbi:unknown [Prevotella sp. CAG:1092]|nr:unknown [Prevotella sp. CAG:1092]